MDHAPLVHLFSGEQFWPCDISEHLVHTTPHLNFTQLQPRKLHPNLTNLDNLNEWDRGRFVYLQSDDNVEERPEWLGGKKNIPSVPNDDRGRRLAARRYGSTWEQGKVGFGDPDKVKRTESESMDGKADSSKERNGPPLEGGRSDAPAFLVVVEKEHGVVDAFWFFFYSYNFGNKVFNVRFGNHIGDWEHTLVRFQHGKPKSVFFSEHYFGEAYSWDAVEKIGTRPVAYSATGTHAMYGTAGTHTYILPLGLLHDVTDRGPLWDPLLNSHTFTYDLGSDDLRPSNITPDSPTAWFYFNGHWGDKIYPLSDPRQYEFAGQFHYVTGPLGPRAKNLGRRVICQGEDCIVKDWLENGPRRWDGVHRGEQAPNDVE
ncbi:MAG: Vacuolar protein sorting-associated protein 62 [Piccolia ochrophora]|nr:MAG: Vacuolar protein sorting-associated protein 62 [Piccolia ochrophora]